METTTRDLTVMEVARELGTTKHRVYEAIHAGVLHAYALTPNTTRITRHDLDAFKRSGGVLAGRAAAGR